MNLPWRSKPIRLCVAALALGSPALAQGRTDYMNVESPQVSPLAITAVAGKTLLLVCNTPDNSLEIWDTDEAIQPPSARFVQRVPVGLEPVSVLVQGSRFWTANFLGDSVTAGIIDLDPNNVLRARITASRNLPAPPGYQRGDEPMDLAYLDLRPSGPEVVLVSMFTGSAIAMLDANSLAPAQSAILAVAPPSDSDAPTHGIKEPRAIRTLGSQVYVLATKGGVTHADSLHDLDVLIGNVSASGVTFVSAVSHLGSTNYNMRFASNGDLYVVGAEAQNFGPNDKPALRAELTGFVWSTLYRRAGTTTYMRDANRTSTNAVVTKSGSTGEGKPTSTLTDLALLESGGVVQKVYVAAMGNDRLGVFTPPVGGVAGNPNVATWLRSTIDLPATTLNSGPRFGPRGLVLAQTASGSRLYVLNRLDDSVLVIDTATDTVLTAQSFALRNDPTPAHVKAGRRFLYDAEMSGKGFVSCASCHIDGRTDALTWRLGNPTGVVQPGVHAELPPDPAFIRSITGTGSTKNLIVGGSVVFTSDPDYELQMEAQLTFDPNVPGALDPADDKREMVTQSLQGLLDYEVAPDAKDLVTNAPFHWRGDKGSVLDFNEAFVTLLEMTDIGTAATGPQGLTVADNLAFEAFVHSITYPPNPKQPKNRTYEANAAQGLEFYHTKRGPLGGRSCVHCHALPEGSNNRLTVFAPDTTILGFVRTPNRQPIESAALRGLFQKEPLLEAGGGSTSPWTPIVGHFGLNHNGLQPLTANVDPVTLVPHTLTSINTFIDLFALPIGATPTAQADLDIIKQFVHELDWGVAPMVGEVGFIDAAVLANPTATGVEIQRILDMQAQTDLANASAVAWLMRPNNTTPLRGFRWAPSVQRWVEEPTYAMWTAFDIATMITGPLDVVLTMAVPLGSERRIASPSGTTVPPPLNLQPLNVGLVGLAPDTAYAGVPTFDANWVPATWYPGVPPGSTVPANPTTFYFLFDAPDHFVPPNTLLPVDDVFAKTLRIFQFGLLDGQNGAGVSYGLPKLRHEAPRRLQVRGTNILMGARLLFSIPDPPPGYTGPPPSQWSTLSNPPVRTIELPIHPTTKVEGSQLVWETAVEFDPLIAYELMLGGPKAPGVQLTITDVITSQHNGTAPTVVEPANNSVTQPYNLPFAPNAWNWYRIEVRNPGTGGTLTSAPVWAQLKMR